MEMEMKIFILSDQEPERKGGVNNVLKNTVPKLRSHNLTITQQTITGLCFHRNTFLKKTPHLVKLLVVTFFTLLKYLHSASKFDVIHAHGISAWIPTILMAKILQKPSVITLHETKDYTILPTFFGGKKLAQLVWKFAIRTVDYLISVANLAPSHRNFVYIPNGVNIEDFNPSEHAVGTKNVLFIGRLSIEKGIKYLVAASKKIKEEYPNSTFTVIAPSASSYINILNANDIEVITAPLSFEELKQYYTRADIFVLPSLHEAFPLVILEAMSCGVPVIASDVGGISDIILDGETGFLVKPQNSTEIFTKIDYLFTHNNERLKMGRQAYKRIKEKFTWELAVLKYLKFYRRIKDEKSVKSNL